MRARQQKIVGSPTLHIDPMTWRRIQAPNIDLEEPRAMSRIMAWFVATLALFAVVGIAVAIVARVTAP